MKKTGKHNWHKKGKFGYTTCRYCNCPYRSKTKDADCKEYIAPEDRKLHRPVINRTAEYIHPLQTPQL